MEMVFEQDAFASKITGGFCRRNLTVLECAWLLTLVVFKAIPDNKNAVDIFIIISLVPKIWRVLSVNVLRKAAEMELPFVKSSSRRSSAFGTVFHHCCCN